MIELWYKIAEALLPYEWAQYEFMRNALLALILVTPLFALLGTMVIGNRMAFFSDVLGHSALTGIAIGMLMGMSDPTWSMVIFAVVLAIAVTLFRGATHASSDTVLGVFFAVVVAIGVVILSRGGSFNKFTGYLIGDILAVTPRHVLWLAVMFIAVLIYWVAFGNNLVLISINPMLARSRGIAVLLIEVSFAALLAVVVAFSIRLVGILIINSLLILPAAASRNISCTTRSYTLWTIAISLFSGIAGLIASYYWSTASGATIVLFAAAFYAAMAVIGAWRRKRIFSG